jgi:hypothetical protein
MTLAHVAVFSWLEAAMARFWAAQSPGAAWGHFASLYRTAFGLSAVFLIVIGRGLWLHAHVGPLFKTALAAGLAGAPPAAWKLGRSGSAPPERCRKAAGSTWPWPSAVWSSASASPWRPGGAAPLLGLGLAPLICPALRPARRAETGPRRPVRAGAGARTTPCTAIPSRMSLALTVVLSSTDRFLLAAFMDEAAVGAYHAGYSIANRTLDVLFLWLGSAGQPALVMALERGGADGSRTPRANSCRPSC